MQASATSKYVRDARHVAAAAFTSGAACCIPKCALAGPGPTAAAAAAKQQQMLLASHRITPIAYTSLAVVADWPNSTSGACKERRSQARCMCVQAQCHTVCIASHGAFGMRKQPGALCIGTAAAPKLLPTCHLGLMRFSVVDITSVPSSTTLQNPKSATCGSNNGRRSEGAVCVSP